MSELDPSTAVVLDRIEEVKLMFYPSSEKQSNGVLMTDGLSTIEMPIPEHISSPKKCELAMVFPKMWPNDFNSSDNENYNWPLHWFRRIVAVPLQKKTWLGEGHSFPAKKLAPITEMSAFILVQPKVISFLNSADKDYSIFAIAPITQKELDFKLKKGAPKFLDKFYSQQSEIVDLQRKGLKMGFVNIFKR